MINIGELSFEAPTELRDATNYTFINVTEPERLLITYLEDITQTATLEDLIEDRRARVKSVFNDLVSFGEEGPTTIGGYPARQLRLTARDSSGRYQEHLAVTRLGDDLYLQIAYVAPGYDKEFTEKFEHIKRSIRLREEKPPSGPAAKYVRRYADRITLDVPVSLRPPAVYLFVSSDPEKQLELIIQDPQAQRPSLYSFESDDQHGLSNQTSDGEIINVPLGIASGVITRRIVTGDATRAVRIGHLIIKDMVRTLILGSVLLPWADELDHCLLMVMKSFRFSE